MLLLNTSGEPADVVATIIRSFLDNVPLEDGFTHPAEAVLRPYVRCSGIDQWVERLLAEEPQDSRQAVLLRLVARVGLPGSSVTRQRLVLDGLARPESELRDATIQAVETWGGAFLSVGCFVSTQTTSPGFKHTPAKLLRTYPTSRKRITMKYGVSREEYHWTRRCRAADTELASLLVSGNLDVKEVSTFVASNGLKVTAHYFTLDERSRDSPPWAGLVCTWEAPVEVPTTLPLCLICDLPLYEARKPTAAEKKWMDELQRVLLKAPPGIGLATMGDPRLYVYDAAAAKRYGIEHIYDGGIEEHGLSLGTVRSAVKIDGVTG